MGTEPTTTVNTNPWRKSTFSDSGACVEVQAIDGGGMNVRDSKDPSGPVLSFTASEVDAFLRGTKAGEFDDLA